MCRKEMEKRDVRRNRFRLPIGHRVRHRIFSRAEAGAPVASSVQLFPGRWAQGLAKMSSLEFSSNGKRQSPRQLVSNVIAFVAGRRG